MTFAFKSSSNGRVDHSKHDEMTLDLRKKIRVPQTPVAFTPTGSGRLVSWFHRHCFTPLPPSPAAPAYRDTYAPAAPAPPPADSAWPVPAPTSLAFSHES